MVLHLLDHCQRVTLIVAVDDLQLEQDVLTRSMRQYRGELTTVDLEIDRLSSRSVDNARNDPLFTNLLYCVAAYFCPLLHRQFSLLRHRCNLTVPSGRRRVNSPTH